MDRRPFSKTAVDLFTRIETGHLTGALCATTLTTIHYLSAKAVGRRKAAAQIQSLLKLFDIAPVSRLVLEEALSMDWPDFEDAVLAASAHHSGADALVTRDPRGFQGSSIPIHSPEELLQVLEHKPS